MRKRYIAAIIVALVLALPLVLVVYVQNVDVQQWVDLAKARVRAATGRELSIDGEVDIAFSVIPTLVLRDLRISNADWSSHADMIQFASIAVELDLLALFSGELRIRHLRLEKPVVVLEVGPENQRNWVFSAPGTVSGVSGKDNGAPPALDVSIGDLQIAHATVTYYGANQSPPFEILIESIGMTASSFVAPIDMVSRARYLGQDFDITATLGSAADLIGNRPHSLRATVKALDWEVDIHTGKFALARPLAAVWLVDLHADSLLSLANALAIELPETGPGIGPLETHFKALRRDQEIVFEDIQLTTGVSDLSGYISVKLDGDRPTAEAKLASRLLDLTPFIKGSSSSSVSGSTATDQRVFSDARWRLDALSHADAKIDLQVDKLVAGSLVTQSVKLDLNLKQGALRIEHSANLYQGQATGSITLSAGKTPDLAVWTDITGVDSGALSNALHGAGVLDGGKTDVSLSLTGQGTSLREWMAGLSGSVKGVLGPGRIDLNSLEKHGGKSARDGLALINPLVAQSDSLALHCAVVIFDIRDGLATSTNQIAMETGQVNVVGTGTINLASEALDLGIKPTAREGVGVGGLAGLVRLRGTLAEPAPATDTGGALMAGASIGAAVATGGVSLLAQALLSSVNDDPSPCATALGKRQAKGTATPKNNDGKSVTATTTLSESASDKVGEAVEGLGSALKGLFGN